MANETILQHTLNRRRFLAGVTAGAAALSLGAVCDPYIVRKLQQSKTALPPHHTAWLWQFSADGAAETVARELGANRLGVLVKTHDGLDWMARFDRSGDAISGPAQIARIARIFEGANVPFHAWSNIRAFDPILEARMTADVLNAGARSLVIDLEHGQGFWGGTPADAVAFGAELRRLVPFARVDVSIDVRPWRLNLIPLREFVQFCDGIWPQLYWDTFNTPGNIDLYRRHGFASPGGMTPELLLDSTWSLLQGYDRPIIPIGQGAAVDPGTWPRFQKRAWELGMGATSVWRYGVTRPATLQYLGQNPAGNAPQPPRTPTKTAVNTPRPTNTSRPTRTSTPTRTPTSKPTRTSTPTKTPTNTPTMPSP